MNYKSVLGVIASSIVITLMRIRIKRRCSYPHVELIDEPIRFVDESISKLENYSRTLTEIEIVGRPSAVEERTEMSSQRVERPSTSYCRSSQASDITTMPRRERPSTSSSIPSMVSQKRTNVSMPRRERRVDVAGLACERLYNQRKQTSRKQMYKLMFNPETWTYIPVY